MYRKIRIESRVSNLRIVENTIDEVINTIGITAENYGKILVSSLEAVNNAILHGNQLIPEKFVEIEIGHRSKNLIVKVTDEGSGFRHDILPDPTMPENIEALSGRGVFLMSRLADKVKYSKRGNIVTMIFKNILP